MVEFAQPTHATELSRDEEADLLIRVKAGDQVACTKLVTLFGPQMMTVARRFMRCEDDCNDALQDAFISAFKALDRFQADSRLSTWLHTITVNSCLMKLRTDSSRRESSIEEQLSLINWRGHYTHRNAPIGDPSAEIEADETRTVVRNAIEQLPDAFRRVLLLRDIEEMDTAATAALLGTTENNVKWRLNRARKALGTLLEPMMIGEMALGQVA
jgi:RNA polymerase sigma-70 factor (ECF subfamily)